MNLNYDEFKREYKRLWLLAQKPENFDSVFDLHQILRGFEEYNKENFPKLEKELAEADNYLEVIEKIEANELIVDGHYKHINFGNGHLREFRENGLVVLECDRNGYRELVNPNELFLIYNPNGHKQRMEQKAIEKFENGKQEFPVGQIVYIGCDNLQAVVLGYDEKQKVVEVMFIGDNDYRGRKVYKNFDELVK